MSHLVASVALDVGVVVVASPSCVARRVRRASTLVVLDLLATHVFLVVRLLAAVAVLGCASDFVDGQCEVVVAHCRSQFVVHEVVVRMFLENLRRQ